MFNRPVLGHCFQVCQLRRQDVRTEALNFTLQLHLPLTYRTLQTRDHTTLKLQVLASLRR